jgi:hypothetical protein
MEQRPMIEQLIARKMMMTMKARKPRQKRLQKLS